jgi:hypothetical protein
MNPTTDRRSFIKTASLALGGVGLAGKSAFAGDRVNHSPRLMTAADLPMGGAPLPVAAPHFPDRLHAFVWRNWQLVPARRMAEVVGASRGDIVRLGQSMGLRGPRPIPASQQRRSALTVIRRNWHLLPYSQLLQLLGWTAEEMAFSLREDDFLFVKLGNLKPQCEPLRYAPPDSAARKRATEIARVLETHFPEGVGLLKEPLFDFVRQLSRMPQRSAKLPRAGAFDPRFCYSYFALYGDPLLQPDLDPYPDGYLARLAEAGVTGVWLQGVLARLAPFPWEPGRSTGYEIRLRNLRAATERARRQGIGIYLYLNEPRALPVSFYSHHPELKGVIEGDFAALCTSTPEVRQYLASAIEGVCRAAPRLAGFFTISASENLTNCWSHHNGAQCTRCSQRDPAEVITELHKAFQEGISKAGFGQKLIAWDWGWADPWVPGIIAGLPSETMFMSVSEWGMPIQRGGVSTTVGEYSISTVGPGERARARWASARARDLKTLAKIQCANTWELSAVPYIPALQNVGEHLAHLRAAGANGLMLGWTLGGYPSPNLEVVDEIASATTGAERAVESALNRVAERRLGQMLAPAVVRAWKNFSSAFCEFPFHAGLVYNAPLQLGPANALWGQPTGYHATMVGFPYDDLGAWRAIYPPAVFVSQFQRVAGGFEQAGEQLAGALAGARHALSPAERRAADAELRVAEAAALHFRSTANQARFILARRRAQDANSGPERRAACLELEEILRAELDAARRLYRIQTLDSRIGFEASNQYFYVPVDLAEKVLNCHDLLTRWLPSLSSTAG